MMQLLTNLLQIETMITILVGMAAFATVLNPEYLNPLLYTTIGNIMLGCCAAWMMTGVLVMRKMINFEI